MSSPVAISAYDLSGVMMEPFARAGFECFCIDLEREETREVGAGVIHHIKADMRDWIPTLDQAKLCQFFCSFSPCDKTSVSGARWFREKGLRGLIDGLELFERGLLWGEWLGVPYFCENPKSTIASYAGPPDYKFHPWQYAGFCSEDNYTKETWLWTGGGFAMPKPHPDQFLGNPDDRIHKAPPGAGRAEFRSKTPTGFAEAVFRANFPKQSERQS